MLQKECCEAANVIVVKRALFITRNSLKSHEERNLLSPVSNTRAITPKLYTYSNRRFFENSRLRIEIMRDTIFDSAPHHLTYPFPRFPPLEVCVRRPRCTWRHLRGPASEK